MMQPTPYYSKKSVYVLPFLENTLSDKVLLEKLKARTELGIKRYKMPLSTFNGRDALRDLEEELLDGIQYAAQHVMETGGNKAVLYTIVQAYTDIFGEVKY